MDKYSNEVQERWGDTPAYTEYSEKTKGYSQAKWDKANDGLMAIFAEFAVCKDSGVSADSAEAQAIVAKLQSTLPPTTILAQMRSSQGLARCTPATSDSRRILIVTVKARRNSFPKPSKSIARSNHKRHRNLRWRL